MQLTVPIGAALCVLLASSAAGASEPRGFEADVSIGASVPFGAAEQTVGVAGSDPAGEQVLPSQINQWFVAAVPLRVALGWRSPHVFVGLAVQYAWTIPATGSGAACAPCQGVGSDVVVGPALDVHISPRQAIDPWIGADFGIESASFTGYFANGGGIPRYESTVNALAWLATWRAGIDFKVADNVRMGPFVGMSAGVFAGPEDGSHGWLFAGVRMVLDSNERR